MLEKNRVRLRAPELSDVEFLYKLENDCQLWHLSNTLVPFSHFDLEQYIIQAEKDIFVAKQARFMIEVFSVNDQKIVGAIDLFDVEAKHKRAGIGIIVIEEERRKGRATTALELIINYAFVHLDLHMLYCNIEEQNEKSLQLFENKGFERVGVKKDWNNNAGVWGNEILLQLINK